MKLNKKRLSAVVLAGSIVGALLYIFTLKEVAVAQVENLGKPSSGTTESALGVPNAEKQVASRKEKLKPVPECQIYAEELDGLAHLSAASGSTFVALNRVMDAAKENGCVGP